MLKEAIEKILSLQAPNVADYGGLRYSDKTLIAVKAPLDDQVHVATLSGLVELVKADINAISEEAIYLHIESPKKVSLKEVHCNQWGDRQFHLVATLPEYGRFAFGQYQDQEAFMIGLQTYFVHGEDDADMAYVLQIAGKLKAEQVQQSDDDGVTQSVALRTGVVLSTETKVKRTVKLRPYRTFREVTQPASEFVFRLRNHKDEVPALALFVADGEMWQHEAMQSIKAYLEANCPNIPVVA